MTDADPAHLEEALRQITAGESYASVARTFGYPDGRSLIRKLVRAGFIVPDPQPRRVLPSLDLSEILRRVTDGESYTSIARSVGRNPSSGGSTIKSNLKTAGFDLPDKTRGHNPVKISDQPTELAYLAGVIDAVAHLGKVRESPMGWRLSINTADKNFLSRLESSVGGHSYLYPRGVGTWVINDRLDLFRLLCAVLPYLTIKRDLAVAVCKQISEHVSVVPACGFSSKNLLRSESIPPADSGDNSKITRTSGDTSLLISARQCSQMCGVGERTWWSRVSEEMTPEPIRFSGATRWRRAEIEVWIEAGCPNRAAWADLCKSGSVPFKQTGLSTLSDASVENSGVDSSGAGIIEETSNSSLVKSPESGVLRDQC